VNDPRRMTSHNNLHTLLFQATSAEYIALCVQTYELARRALEERLEEGTLRNPAVVLDLDETVLDNSPYQAWQVETGTNFHEPTSWKRWCDLGKSNAVPGAVEFVHFAADSGVTPIFITSRLNSSRAGTALNLATLGLISQSELDKERSPDGDHPLITRLFMKGMADAEVDRPGGKKVFRLQNKFEQRVFCEQVREFEVALSIGDNLSDYAEYYSRVLDSRGDVVKDQHPTPRGRRSYALQDARLFGRDFILLPNATYGGWLRALEANKLGAGDELANTELPVREGLREPPERFDYVTEKGPQSVQPDGPKLGKNVSRWDGKTGVSPVED
jgi:predicted secreted acid phosphatase